jgi:hypothetical protein
VNPLTEAATAHDHGPHVTDVGNYTETWFWDGRDPVSGTVVWLHCSWIPARGFGQHTMAVIRDGVTERRCVRTETPFTSELAAITILDPWSRAHITSAELDVDIEWVAFHDPIDFGGLLHVDAGIHLDHFEGGGRGRGSVGGRPFLGHGFRDRSFGPRDMRGFGRNWAIGMTGVETDSFVTAMVATGAEQRLEESPGRVLGCMYKDGKASIFDGGVSLLRWRDATPAVARLPEGVELRFDPTSVIGQSRFLFDPLSSPAVEPTEERCYSVLDTYLCADSEQVGRVVGFYEDGVLCT